MIFWVYELIYNKVNTLIPTEDTSNRICKDVTDTVGHTPLVYLNKVTKGVDAKIAVKLEYLNPGLSVKDRPALNMIDQAEKAGLIKPGDVLLEGTSGNMGIGLAMAAAVKGYRLVLVMPECYSIERRVICKALGAELVIVDKNTPLEGLLKRLEQLNALIPNSFMTNQFANENNPKAHYLSTGPEIWKQTQGKVDIAVFGAGTGGTVTGVGQYLKEKNPNIKIYVVEPYESSVISGNPPGCHHIQGIGASTIPPNLKPGYDGIIRVKEHDAFVMARRIAKEEGILCGISSGANVVGALEIANRKENAGKLIVTCLPSFGERYLSTELYKGIKDQCELLKSTTFEENKEHLKTIFKLQ